MAEHTLEAPPNAGRLDRWLAEVMQLPRRRVSVLFDAGRVRVDGQIVKPARKLRGGETVVVDVPPPQPTTLESQPMDLDIVHEDEAVIVLNKPAGLVVHPGRGNLDHTLVNALLDRLDTSDGGPGHPERPGIVHRLDKGTSGVMVVARTRAAYEGLIGQFAEHSVDRRYLALVWGFVRGDAGTIDQPIGRHPTNRIRFAVVPGAKRAITHWSLLERAPFKVPGGMGYLSLLECRLETGRTHQVRVHLSDLGHPVVGDSIYVRPLYKPRNHLPTPLREAVAALEHQLLHARMLGFCHPLNGERLERRCAPPPDYQAVLDAAGITL